MSSMTDLQSNLYKTFWLNYDDAPKIREDARQDDYATVTRIAVQAHKELAGINLVFRQLAAGAIGVISGSLVYTGTSRKIAAVVVGAIVTGALYKFAPGALSSLVGPVFAWKYQEDARYGPIVESLRRGRYWIVPHWFERTKNDKTYDEESKAARRLRAIELAYGEVSKLFPPQSEVAPKQFEKQLRMAMRRLELPEENTVAAALVAAYHEPRFIHAQ